MESERGGTVIEATFFSVIAQILCLEPKVVRPNFSFSGGFELANSESSNTSKRKGPARSILLTWKVKKEKGPVSYGVIFVFRFALLLNG